jgi:hypothetical protein
MRCNAAMTGVPKGYRPPNMLEWATRKGLDLNQIIAEPEKFQQFTNPVMATGIESSIKI